MKLAEALMERKAIKDKMEELKKRIYQCSKIQEGDDPIEMPIDLIKQLETEVSKFEELIIRINRTNNEAKLTSSNLTLMEAIIKKDMLNYLYTIQINLADKATPTHERMSTREIKFVPNVNIIDTRTKATQIAKEYRLLDAKIQEANWTVELI